MSEQYGWVWEPTPKHLCSPPLRDLTDHFEGALWRCQECGQFWEVYAVGERLKDKGMQMIAPTVALQRMGLTYDDDDAIPMKRGG